jgi:hypothetical protein
MVVVHLRPDTEDDHACVPFDQARVLRVLARMAADFDGLAQDSSGSETARPEENGDPRTWHRRRLAVPDESPRGRTAKVPRDARRKAAGLPPYHGDDADDVRGRSSLRTTCGPRSLAALRPRHWHTWRSCP